LSFYILFIGTDYKSAPAGGFYILLIDWHGLQIRASGAAAVRELRVYKGWV
jgi:hypothetical protein